MVGPSNRFVSILLSEIIELDCNQFNEIFIYFNCTVVWVDGGCIFKAVGSNRLVRKIMDNTVEKFDAQLLNVKKQH